MQLDVTTVEAVTILVFALTAGFLLWTWWTQRTGSALVWWSLTFVVAAASSLLTLEVDARPAPFILLVDDYLLIVSHLLLWGGFRAFNRAGAPVPWAVLALGGFTLAVFALPMPPRAFLDLSILIALAITVAAVVEFRRLVEPGLAWTRIAVAVMAAHGAFLALRLFLAPDPPLPAFVGGDHLVLVLFLLEPMLAAVALGFTVIGMVSERTGAAHEAAARADPLTGALNRRGLHSWFIARRARRARFGERGCAVILADLDRFKAVNDTFGHATGDAVLKAFVERAGRHLRAEDALVRTGGEEFLVVMEAADEAAALAVAERIRAAVAAERVAAGGEWIPLTASFGVAASGPVARFEDLERLVEAADEAVYRAKAAGRNRVEVAPPLAGRTAA